MTKDETILLGEGAQRLLNDESAAKAFVSIVSDAKERWAATRPDDVEGREAAFRMIAAIGAMKACLQKMADDARVESSNAEFRTKEQSGLSAHS